MKGANNPSLNKTMSNAGSPFVESEVDLPDKTIPVTVSLESIGVAFATFRMDLVMGDTIARNVKLDGTHRDIGREFALGNALALRGLVLVTRGFVGAGAAGKIRMRCIFRFDSTQRDSAEAVVELTQGSSSGAFRIRSEFV
jgi:hypothetical protein